MMKSFIFLYRCFLLLIFAGYVSLQATGQEPHVCGVDSCGHIFKIARPLSASPDTLPVDTFITEFYRHHHIFVSNLLFPVGKGTSGHPAFDMFRSFDKPSMDYLYHNPYKHYTINRENISIIRSDVPYSEWYYLIGAHREQIFHATHAQDAGQALNFGLDLKFINNQGAYQHEHARSSYLGVYAQYRNPKLPLRSDLFLFFNGATTDENGGISDHSYFVDTTMINRQLVPVWLGSARNRYRSSEVLLRNSWHPGLPQIRKPGNGDSLAVGQDTIPRFRRLQHHFTLELGAKRMWFLYTDSDPFNPWYSLTRYDTTITNDSVAQTSFYADLAYHLLAWQKIDVTAGLRLQAYSFYDTLNPDGSGSAMVPYTRWVFKLLPALTLDADASAVFDNRFGVSHQVNARMLWRITRRYSLEVNIRDWTAFPFRQDLEYASNHFLWKNDFQNQHFSQLNPVFRIKGRYPAELAGFATRINRYIYYNSQALPNQFLGDVMLYQALLTNQGEVGRFSFSTKIAWQYTSDQSVLRQPMLLGEIATGIRFSLFSGKMDATAGVIVYGRSKAYLDEYMPVTRVFYHTVRPPVKEYIWADPYVSFQVKKTRFILKYEHATAWLAGFGQYTLPGYPMADPAVKFAVAWRFME